MWNDAMEKMALGQVYSLRTLVVHCLYQSVNAPYTVIHLP